MAVTKIHPIKSTLKKALDYIENPDKTDEKLFVSSYGCSYETADIEFQMLLDQAYQKGNNLAHHLIQAFEPGETTAEQAHEIGRQLADEVLQGKYPYVITTHIDKGHLHNHIIFCAVDMANQRKYISNRQSYAFIRRTSDRLCKEHGLSVVKPGKDKGKTYAEACEGRWKMTVPMPDKYKDMVMYDATADAEEIASKVDFIFCAVNMPKAEIKALEEAYAKAECPVVSNNSANRFTPDVPMVVPEINADHIEIIPAQRKRLGTKRGFIAVKSNCSLQSYVPALHPLMKDFGVSKALVCTYQAISGAGKTFDRMPEIVDNVIPYIGGEEEKSEREPLKLWGHIEGDQIVNAEKPVITAQCFRVPVSDGHTAAVFVSFDKKPTKEQMLEAWANFRGPAQELNLPSAPKQFLHYFTEPDRPQPKLDRNTENGMAVCIGRLREDTLFDYKFACMSHNTLRGAAGGAVLLAELLAAKGYMD